METTILPCPFCGSENIEFGTFNYKESMYQDTYDSAIQCNDCEAKGGGVGINIKYHNGRDITDYDTYKKEAIELWNRRLEPNKEVI